MIKNAVGFLMLLAQGPSLIKRSLEASILHWQKGNTIHHNRLFFSLLRKRNSFIVP